jgi:putative endonuclease
MALKSTKAILQPSTCKASLSTSRVCTTVVRSPALKNTSKRSAKKNAPAKPMYWAHKRGLISEDRVRVYYQKKFYTLIEQRVKTPFAELDLLFRTPEGHLLIVEVKTANLASFYNYKVTPRQKFRLLRAVQFLAERFSTLVEIHWAFVTKEGEITIISDISG